MKYEVRKMYYGVDGKLHSHPAKRFTTLDEAREYAADFAEDQRSVAGTFIVVKARKGDRLLTKYTCGSEFRVAHFS